MSNWFKKKLQQLSDKLNADDELPQQSHSGSEAAATGKSLSNQQAAAVSRFDNIEELKEITIGAINRAIKIMGYGNSTVTGFVFHSGFADNAIENVAVHTLAKDLEFIRQIKRTLKSRSVAFKDDLTVEVVNGSALFDKVTPIMDGIGVEVLIPGESLRKIKARVVATEGITWEPEYFLEPSGKIYFIGRCKDLRLITDLKYIMI